MKKILAVIVTYNRKEMLQKCINALTEQSISDFDILVIDNGSSDHTREYLNTLELSGAIVTLFMEENLGGAGGFHAGIRYALKNAYTHIWLMDDDSIAAPDALQKLLEADAKIRSYGFLVSLPVWSDNSICRMNRPRLDSLFEENAEILGSGYLPVKNATFVSMMLRAETVYSVGLPIKEFFIWGDDWEYTERISRHYRNYLILSSKVNHLMKSNVGSDLSSDNSHRIDRYYYAYRNEFYISKKKGFLSTAYYFFRIAVMLLKILTHSSTSKTKRIKCLFHGMIAGFSFNPTVEQV